MSAATAHEFFAASAGVAGGLIGLLFVLAALLRLVPAARTGEVRPRELAFLAALLVVFVIQLVAGIELEIHSGSTDNLQTICVLVLVCFLIWIERAWELVGVPQVALFSSLAERRRRHEEDGP